MTDITRIQVIFNADDFGRSAPINAAVVRAHRQGVLTSTSLMVAADAAEEAIALARQTPTLAVGLHVMMASGRPTLKPGQLPHLVDVRGWLPADPVSLSLRYVLSRTVRKELACEVRAQFDRFAATGLPLSHVDSHLHIHVHPALFHLLLTLAEEYGARGIRLPRDDLRLALGYDHRRMGTKAVWAVVFGLLCRRQQGRLHRSCLAVAHRVYGLMQTGRMEEGYVVRLLRRLDVPTAECYFHPTTAPDAEPLGPNPGDLATLLSPTVREVIQARGLHLTTYPLLHGGAS